MDFPDTIALRPCIQKLHRVSKYQPFYESDRHFRKGFIPRVAADFGDGGAFPEIHVAQYPMDMGRPDPRGSGSGKKSNAIAVQLDAEGKVIKEDRFVPFGIGES